jgi:cysteine desulfurase
MTDGFGNAHSTEHAIGDAAEAAVKTAKQQVADLVGAAPRDIIFTSGATESLNLPIQGTLQHLENRGIHPHIALSAVEHKAVLAFTEWGITMLALSAHKFYGPQGVGALVVKRGHPLEPLLYGGGHQRGLRSGTLNLPGIVGLGEACRLRAIERAEDERKIGEQRDLLQHLLAAKIPGLVVNDAPENRLAGNLHISIPGIPNSAVISRVRHQLAISTGSACSSGVEAPSHVLRAMSLNDEIVEGSLRIGLGKFTTDTEVASAAEILSQAVHSVRAAMMV